MAEWKEKVKKFDDTRVIRRFAFIPISIEVEGYNITKWFEPVVYEEVWTKGRTIDFWRKTRWLK